jgi:hypothetical protein
MEEDPALVTCAGLMTDVPDTVNAKRFPPEPFVLGDVHAPGPPWVSQDLGSVEHG